MASVVNRTVMIAASIMLATSAASGAASAQPTAPVLPQAAFMPMASASTTLHLPDGRRTAHVWKTWYRKANGKYRGHYGWTSASKGVSVYAFLATSDKTRYLPTKGKSYSYSNESSVVLFACDNAYPNGTDCTTDW